MRRLDKQVSALVTDAMLVTLRELKVDVDHPGFGMVILLIEPNPDGTARMHLGAYGLDDEEVIEMLTEAPRCVQATQQNEAAAKARGST